MMKSRRGCKIVVGWNPEDVNIMEIHSCRQVMLCLVETERRELWKCLKMYTRIIDSKPWVLMGDWNSRLNPSNGILKKIDRVMGNTTFIGKNERNKRLFANARRNDQELMIVINNCVRMKIVSLTVKNSKQVAEVSKIWQVSMKKRNTEEILVQEWDNSHLG
ncbi:RNA-directed DNA polymerase, eukaryota, Reverse transcriptase zinc-binding domain protein [Artemisia annua]|uniref:RNA-directed DNA polymerase, eukaryota, Reverse transcriptase zinc-binding domain protein n=1 Tax=Artemisia annua TaxID=35608 RepID=A0A2U1LI29_ARTAN|nr:RNA-directed DNA polymerase, eukaryota, Reverse transcriptase zinc-binding domain protein [Artemisia annua]